MQTDDANDAEIPKVISKPQSLIGASGRRGCRAPGPWNGARCKADRAATKSARRSRHGALASNGPQRSIVARRGHARKKQRLKPADTKQASALRVSVVCWFIFELPCRITAPCIRHCGHSSQSMSDCLDRQVQRLSPLPPLPPRRPQEAGQLGSLGVPSHGWQVPLMALRWQLQPVATAHLPQWLTSRYRPESPVHRSPPQPPAPSRQIPSQLAHDAQYLVRQGPTSPPPRLRAG